MFYVLRFLWKRKIKYFFTFIFINKFYVFSLSFYVYVLFHILRFILHFFILRLFTFFLCLRLFTFFNIFYVFVYETEHKHKNYIFILRLRFFYENGKKPVKYEQLLNSEIIFNIPQNIILYPKNLVPKPAIREVRITKYMGNCKYNPVPS